MTNPLDRAPDYTDDGVVEVLAPDVADALAFTTGLGWMHYAGGVWRRDPDGRRAGQVVGRWMRRHAPDLMGRVPAAQRRQLASLLSEARHNRIMSRLSRALLVDVEEWDADPLLLCTPTEVVDLSDGSTRPHDPALRMTRATAVGYEKGATHPDWEQALRCQPDDDTRRWLQAHLGSGCLGATRGDSLALLTGNGANGKSTVTSAVVAALGTYAGPVDRSVIVGKGHEEHKAALRGLRFGLVEELADGHRLNMAEVKGLVGTREVTARHLFQPSMRFTMQATLVVTTNYKPQVPDTDHGTWRRLARVEFPLRYGTEPGDLPLDTGLRERCSTDPDVLRAVLAWLVEGAQMPVPGPSPDMEARQREWREEVDSIAAFIVDCIDVDATATTSRKDLYLAFCVWADEQGQMQWAQRTFTQRWSVHPYVDAMRLDDVMIGGTRSYRGLSIKATASPTIPF